MLPSSILDDTAPERSNGVALELALERLAENEGRLDPDDKPVILFFTVVVMEEQEPVLGGLPNTEGAK